MVEEAEWQITSPEQHALDVARIEELMAVELLSAGEAALLEALAACVQEYEADVYPVGPPTAEAAREFRKEQEGG